MYYRFYYRIYGITLSRPRYQGIVDDSLSQIMLECPKAHDECECVNIVWYACSCKLSEIANWNMFKLLIASWFKYVNSKFESGLQPDQW